MFLITKKNTCFKPADLVMKAIGRCEDDSLVKPPASQYMRKFLAKQLKVTPASVMKLGVANILTQGCHSLQHS